MPPVSQNPQPRRVAAVRPTLALLAWFALLALPGFAMAWGSTMDPVFVFYPRNFCSGEKIALEVWDRNEQRWAKHPRHPVIPVDSCQLEDAGVLLNEIRWRCLERGHSDWDEGWSVGVRVFENTVMQRCDVALPYRRTLGDTEAEDLRRRFVRSYVAMGLGDVVFVEKDDHHGFDITSETDHAVTVWCYGGAASLAEAGYVWEEETATAIAL